MNARDQPKRTPLYATLFPKKPENPTLEELRPIVLLKITRKCRTCLIVAAIMDQIEKHYVLSEAQHGLGGKEARTRLTYIYKMPWKRPGSTANRYMGHPGISLRLSNRWEDLLYDWPGKGSESQMKLFTGLSNWAGTTMR